MSNPIVVYDLCYPSPVPLKEIALNKIVIELWRQEIHKHRTKGTLKQINFENIISSSVLHPYVPSLLLATIEKKISPVGTSIKRWVDCYNEKQIFQSHALREFDDFVCDFDGSIDYGKTARKMMLCDEISQIAKFKIACLCCFEDEIKLLWPSVSSQLHLKDINMRKNSQLFYWICYLRNQSYKIPVSSDINRGEKLNVSIFYSLCYSTDHWPSVEYFLNRFTPSTRPRHTKKILRWLPVEFHRYLLAKLNEEELDKFLTINRDVFRKFFYYDKSLIFWSYAKHKITADSFVCLIIDILLDSKSCEILPEIWISAPDHFKQSAIQRLLLDDTFKQFQKSSSAVSIDIFNFWMSAISYASFQDRRIFWNENCIALLKVMNTCQLQQLIAICFESEDEIIRYKETVMSDFEKIGEYCRYFVSCFHFEELNRILNFCFTGEQNIRSMKLRLLNENFHFSRYCLDKADTFNKFINDAFIDIDRATEFKIQVLSRHRFIDRFQSAINEGSLHLVKNFIETLLPSEPAMKDYRKRFLFLNFKTCLTNGSYLMKRGDVDYQNFLRWCLENDDEIAQLKQSLPVDGIVQAVICREIERMRENPEWSRGDRSPMTYHPKLIEFLKWYFVIPEAYDNFVAKYADDEDFVNLITPTEHNVK